MKKKTIIRFLATVMAASVVFAGCGNEKTAEAPAPAAAAASVSAEEAAEAVTDVQEEKTESVAAASAVTAVSEEEKIAPPVIGTVKEELQPVTFANESGMNITAVAVKAANEEEFGENLLPEEETFAAEETRSFYFEAKEEEEYSVQLTFDDDSKAELKAFPFDAEGIVALKKDGDIFYLEYEKDGEKINTKEAKSEESASGTVEYTNTVDNTADYDYNAAETAAEPADNTASNQDEGCLDNPMVYEGESSDPNVSAPENTGNEGGEQAPAAVDVPADNGAAASPDAGCLGDDAMTY
ncbi:MAG: hypothetical protein Q4B22_07555 [Eubacteriales bacterium]|nr:hypothetical protein [Eubacteriales bacterium]